MVLVTLSPDGSLLDRRTVALTTGLPTHPYHHEGPGAVGRSVDSPGATPTPLADADALVARVHEAALAGAGAALDVLAKAVLSISAITIRAYPALPPTIEARIRDTRAASTADSVVYRQALAAAAEARGWRVHWYNRDTVAGDAAGAGRDVDARVRSMGRAAGAPWQAKHKLAATAALAALATKYIR